MAGVSMRMASCRPSLGCRSQCVESGAALVCLGAGTQAVVVELCVRSIQSSTCPACVLIFQGQPVGSGAEGRRRHLGLELSQHAQARDMEVRRCTAAACVAWGCRCRRFAVLTLNNLLLSTSTIATYVIMLLSACADLPAGWRTATSTSVTHFMMHVSACADLTAGCLCWHL